MILKFSPLVFILQAPVVQTLETAIQRLSTWETNCVIQWIAFHPVDSAIQRLSTGATSIVSLD